MSFSGTLAVTIGRSALPDHRMVSASAAPNSRPRSDGLIGDASTRTSTSSALGCGMGIAASDNSSVPSCLIVDRSCSASPESCLAILGDSTPWAGRVTSTKRPLELEPAGRTYRGELDGFSATILQFKSAILAFSASVHAWPPLCRRSSDSSTQAGKTRMASSARMTFRPPRIKSRFCSQIGQAALFEGAERTTVNPALCKAAQTSAGYID